MVFDHRDKRGGVVLARVQFEIARSGLAGVGGDRLRHRVRLRTDGGIKTGRDVVIGAGRTDAIDGLDGTLPSNDGTLNHTGEPLVPIAFLDRSEWSGTTVRFLTSRKPHA